MIRQFFGSDKETIRKNIIVYAIELILIGIFVLVMRLIATFGFENQWQVFNTLRGNKSMIFFVSIVLWCCTIAIRKFSELKESRWKKIFLHIGFLVLILGTALFVFWDYLMQDCMYIFTDWGADTLFQYFPQYLSNLQRFMDGDFTSWNWDYGLGTSILNYMSLIMDPFGLLTELGGYVFGIDRMAKCLVLALILKSVVAGFLCRYFLSLFHLSSRACMIGGYIYAFNAYLILWGQHYFLGTICVYLMLMLIFAEKMITGNKICYFVGFSLSVGTSLIYSVYSSYMALAFVVIYGIVRLIQPELTLTLKERLLKFGKCAYAAVIGLLISMTVLLPMAEYLAHNSVRLQNETSLFDRTVKAFFSVYSPRENFEILTRLMSNNLMYVNSLVHSGWQNYYEMPNLAITVFFYLFLGQFAFLLFRRRKIGKHSAIYAIIVIAVAYLIIFNPAMATAFNGFTYVATRHTFVIMPVLALMVAYVWQRVFEEHEFSLPGLICGAAVSAFVLIHARQICSEETMLHIYKMSVCVAIFTVVLICFWKFEKARAVLLPVAMICILYTTGLDNYFTTSSRATFEETAAGQNYYVHNVHGTTERILEMLKEEDDSFFRVDKDYAEFSTYGDSLVYQYSAITNYNSTMNANLVSFYDNLYNEAEVDEKQQQIELSSNSIYLLGALDVKYILAEKAIDDVQGLELINEVDGIYVYRNTYANEIATFYTHSHSKSKAEELTMDERQQLLENTVIVDDLNDIYDGEIEDANVSVSTFKEDGNSISGTVSTDTAGLLMLAIPDQNGWKVYVDGQEVETINADYGFMAIKLEPGTYEIEATYHVPYLTLGKHLSIAGVILLILSSSLFYWIRKKNDLNVI